MNQQQTHEAVAVFDDMNALDHAVAELEATSFARHDISVLGSASKKRHVFGVSAIRPSVAEDNPVAPRGILVRPEEKVIGASTLIGIMMYAGVIGGIVFAGSVSMQWLIATAGAGGILGALIGSIAVLVIGQRMRRHAALQVAAGGTVLWVNTPEPEREQLALEILVRHGGRDVHIH